MKKIIVLLISILIIISSITSCALSSGKSIMISKVLLFNNPLSILNYYLSYSEIMTYYEENGNKYEYSIYIEESEKKDVYNICEKHNDNTFFAYNGNIYTEKDNDIYSIILAFGTYSEITLKYIETRNTDFDNLTSYQKYSKEYTKDNQKIIEVAYSAKVTPTIATKYNSLGIDIGDDILIIYYIDKSTNLFSNISYYRVSKNETTLFLSRDYIYNSEKLDMFSNIPIGNKTIDISIMYSPNTEAESISNYKILSGTKLGIETQSRTLDFYINKECTIPFEYNTFMPKQGDMLYGVYK